MNSFRFALIIAVLPALLSAGPTPKPQDGQIVVNVERVNILFSVKDNKGKLITNLKQSDFKLYEDDKPQTIERVTLDSDLPLHIALLMDQSNTVLDQLKLEKDSAIEFLNKILKRGKDKAMVIGFDTEVSTLQDFTDDVEKLSEPIRRIRAGGSTAVFDALYIASNKYLSKQPSRRMIVLISDGQDNSSTKTLADVLLSAQRSEVVVYAINPNIPGSTSGSDPKERDKGDKALRQLAEDTGGHAFFPKKLDDLETGFQNIGEEMRSQYSMIYSPTNKERDGTFRRYKIVPINKSYKVSMPKGYWASR
jgi:VWFA-related protein